MKMWPPSGEFIHLIAFIVLLDADFSSAATVPLTLLDNVGILINTGVSDSFAVDNQTVCTDLCSGSTKISAVSYSVHYNRCITSSCALLRTSPNALWKTYSCTAQMNAVCYIQPKFEWMLTDSCGNANTGWYKPGLLMKPIAGGALYNISYNRSVTLQLGNAMTFPNLANYYAVTDSSEFKLEYAKAFTLFAAFNVSTPRTLSNFAFFEFANYALDSYSAGFQFWQYASAGGTYYTFDFNGGACSRGIAFDYAVNVPHYVALVYNYVGSNVANIIVYFDGSAISQYACNVQSDMTTRNLVMGARPFIANNGFGSLNGAVYCLKIFDKALSQSQIRDLQTTCITGRLLL